MIDHHKYIFIQTPTDTTLSEREALFILNMQDEMNLRLKDLYPSALAENPSLSQEQYLNIKLKEELDRRLVESVEIKVSDFRMALVRNSLSYRNAQ